MNAITAVFQFAMAHPYLSSGIVLSVAGGVGYGVYKLADKGIDAAGHAVDHALDNRYSFEFPNASFKAYPQGSQVQTLPATC